MKQIISYKPYPYQVTMYLSDWFPLIGSGWSITLLNIAFIKYTYYVNPDGTKTTQIAWDISLEQDVAGFGSTHQTMMHEYSHTVLKKQIGTVKYDAWCIYDYGRFWISHDKKPIEIRVEEIRKTLVNPY